MEKESYNIDDILSEVKKRREDREKAESSDVENKDTVEVKEETVEFHSNIDDTVSTAKSDETEFKEVVILKSDDSLDESDEQQAEESNFVINDEPIEQEIPEPQFVQINEVSPSSDDEEAVDEDDSIADNQEAEDNGEFVDLLAYASVDTPEIADDYKEELKNNKRSKRSKIIKRILIAILIIVLIAGAGAGVYIYKALNQITPSTPTKQEDSSWKGMNDLVENFPEIKETEANQLSSLQDMIKTWYYNGEPCSSTHVLNVLLIGEDTRGTEILEDETRADSAIIASVNIDTGKITLTSILRDAYAYWENTAGDESTANFGKINGAMSIGDVHAYINCVEKLYKINIDNYVIVNFDSFEAIIDEIGGVTLELTSAEIYEINSHPKRYGNVYIEQTFTGSSGEMKLNGKQALAYCRIRKLDSDNMRANRQKICLNAIFDGVKNASKVDLLKIVNTLIPYVKTGFSSKDIVSVAKGALSQGWLSYDVVTTSVPYARIEEKGVGGIYYGAWCWKPDYPQDAYYLQTILYGKTGITLAQERVDVLNCAEYGFYSETLTPVYSTIYNYSYGEPTTFEQTTQEESSSTSN